MVDAEAALFFYAGHGLQVNGKNYLLPVDALIENETHLKYRAARFDDILEPMADKSNASLVFLDACRDNPFARTLMRKQGGAARRLEIRGGLARVGRVAGSFIAFSTAPDHVAFDGKGENSPFTTALLKHIETPGLSVSDMMIDVRNSVIAATAGKQEPWDQSSLRAPFYFVPAQAQPARVGGAYNLSEAAEAWISIQNVTSIAVLTKFMELYPATTYAKFAEVRIVELRTLEESKVEVARIEEVAPPAGVKRFEVPVKDIPKNIAKAAKRARYSGRPKIFLSYRRDDARAEARAIFQSLATSFSRGNVFMDVDAIQPGMNFARYIENQVVECNVFLAVIGRAWLSSRSSSGSRRIDDADDFVRIETQIALEREVLIIPVLVDGASMPKAEDLPQSLQSLSFRQAMLVRHESFRSDIDAIVRQIRGQKASFWARLMGGS